MIAQIWRGRTRADDRDDFTSLLQARVEAELARSSVCRGAYVLQRQIGSGQVESLMVTLYDPRSVAGCRGEESPQPPPPSDREVRLLLDCDPSSARYEVIVDPHRALLYAELRRRYPLRFAAPR